MKTILLTGAGGFLGRQLLWHLKDSDKYHVYAVTSNTERLNDIITASNIEVIKKGEDINWNSVDIVIHCAFARSGKSSEYITSLDYSKYIFHKVISNNVPALINISSQSVYGNNPNIPWTEESELMPHDLYGMAKAATEILLDGISKGGSTVITNLRLSSIMLNARFVNIFVENALTGTPINIIGGSQQVSFMDIRDAADGIIALIHTPISKWNKVYNLGTGVQNSIVEIAEIVKETASYYVDKEVVINIEEKDIPLNPCMDVSKFSNLTDWHAQFNIKDMVKSQFEYLLDINQSTAADGGGWGGATRYKTAYYPFTYLFQ